MEDYIIDKASRHTQRPRNYEFDITQIYKYLRSLIDYLEANGLLNNSILAADQEVTDDTQVKASDLTEEGLEFIKVVYGKSKWIDMVFEGENLRMTINC